MKRFTLSEEVINNILRVLSQNEIVQLISAIQKDAKLVEEPEDEISTEVDREI